MQIAMMAAMVTVSQYPDHPAEEPSARLPSRG
jgi:hypothetical protein